MALKILLPLAGITAVLSYIVLNKDLGGYGNILWSYHPLLMIVAFCFFMPLGLNAQFSSTIKFRDMHGYLMALGGLMAISGAAVAWYVHEQKNHNHIPWGSSDIAKWGHVIGGISLVAMIFFQSVGGNLQKFGLISREQGKAHGQFGYFVYASFVPLMAGGFYLMLRKKADSGLALLTAITLVIAAAVIGYKGLQQGREARENVRKAAFAKARESNSRSSSKRVE